MFLEEMATWINVLVQASLGFEIAQPVSDVAQSVVYSVKGMMCVEHGDVVRAVVSEIEVCNIKEFLSPCRE